MGLSPLLGLCSLIKLNLRDCNLKAIPDDIGSLFSLEQLILDGNKFVCLPESIGQLSQLFFLDLSKNNLKCLPKSIGQLSNLNSMRVNNCTSLRSLPKLPSNIEVVGATNCISLEMLPDLLKPNDPFKPHLFLQNCFKLVDNQCLIDEYFAA